MCCWVFKLDLFVKHHLYLYRLSWVLFRLIMFYVYKCLLVLHENAICLVLVELNHNLVSTELLWCHTVCVGSLQVPDFLSQSTTRHISLIGSSKLSVGVSVDSWPSVLAHDEVATHPGSTQPSPSNRLHHSGNPKCWRSSDKKMKEWIHHQFPDKSRRVAKTTWSYHLLNEFLSCKEIYEDCVGTSTCHQFRSQFGVYLAWCSARKGLMEAALFP